MADDTMEISSEHGHDMGDDDIDIDIDFSTGQLDEDYILEDATSNIEFGDEMNLQPSPAAAHDDMMTDEYEDPFPVPVDGEDIMRDEDSHSMIHDPLDVSFPVDDVPTVAVDSSVLETSHVTTEGQMKETEVIWDTNGEPEQRYAAAAGDMRESEVTWDTNDGSEQQPAAGDGEIGQSKITWDTNDESEQQHAVTDGEMNEPEISWETNDVPEHGTLATDEYQEDSEEKNITVEEAGESEEGHNTGSNHSATPIATTAIAGKTYSHSPRNLSPSGAVNQSPSSPIASITEPITGNDKSEHANELHDTSYPHEIDHLSESRDAGSTRDASTRNEVIVVYREAEYSLFAKSATDDADAYFISDLSIKDKPLAKFFETIREVLHEEISDDVELCLSVTDLGLEVEEMSQLTGSFTMEQIIDLHEKLIQNDEGRTNSLLYILLRTRPKFSKQFPSLVSAALEGRGMTEVLAWIEHSEAPNSSEHFTDAEHVEALEEDDYDNSNLAEDQGNDLHQQDASDDTIGHEEAIQSSSIESVPESPVTPLATTVGDSASGSLLIPNSVEAAATSQKSESSKEEFVKGDEEEDLIDYSDEEEEVVPEPRKSAKLRSATDDSKTNTAEYEVINEDLRRRSISLSAEGALLDEAADTEKAEIKDGEPEFEAEDNVQEYDDFYGESLEIGNVHEEPEEPSADYGEYDVDPESYNNEEDDFFIEEGEAEVEEHFEVQESVSGGLHGEHDEIHFGDGDTHQYNEFTDFDDQETVSHEDPFTDNNGHTHVTVPTKDAEAAESESAASERTLEAQPFTIGEPQKDAKEDNLDMISYDEDDELDIIKVHEPIVKELATPNSGSGKRQRADGDVSRNGSQDSKRARS